MNCDQVFDILTRGPFPTGTACDPPVEAHLSVCPECRRLAEALRPALELFQEAVGPEESRDLPGYWCAVATDSKPPVVSYAPLVESRPAAPRAWPQVPLVKQYSALAVWRVAALAAIALAAGSLVGARMNWDGFSNMPPLTTAATDPDEGPRMSLSQRMELAALPAACYRNLPHKSRRYTDRGDQLLAAANLEGLSCCTDCHNSTADNVSKAATLQVVKHCELCHAEKSLE